MTQPTKMLLLEKFFSGDKVDRNCYVFPSPSLNRRQPKANKMDHRDNITTKEILRSPNTIRKVGRECSHPSGDYYLNGLGINGI